VDQPVKGSVVSRTTNNCDRVLTCYDLPAVSKVPAHVFRRGQKTDCRRITAESSDFRHVDSVPRLQMGAKSLIKAQDA
jgi:hypothetical protein